MVASLPNRALCVQVGGFAPLLTFSRKTHFFFTYFVKNTLGKYFSALCTQLQAKNQIDKTSCYINKKEIRKKVNVGSKKKYLYKTLFMTSLHHLLGRDPFLVTSSSHRQRPFPCHFMISSAETLSLSLHLLLGRDPFLWVDLEEFGDQVLGSHGDVSKS